MSVTGGSHLKHPQSVPRGNARLQCRRLDYILERHRFCPHYFQTTTAPDMASSKNISNFPVNDKEP